MSGNSKTVLVTDDDKMILEGFKDLFEGRGYRVLLAENGDIALARLQREQVDIVFLDIVMPYKEGLETLIEMRRKFPDMPIYAMSGGGKHNKQDFFSLAQKFGASGILRKPVEPDAVLKLAQDTLGRAT